MRLLFTIIASASCITHAPAGSDPDFGYDFVTIGDPGNRATRPDELVWFPNQEFGAVDYEYRISTTEVSVGQWFEFVGAYLTVFPGRYGSQLTGYAIDDFFGQPTLNQGHSFAEPANMSWEYAARYVNWLHNDKALTPDAFNSGAYEVSTFTQNPDGSFNHQLGHTLGAKFWIPTHDEWVKAAYWDPDKNEGDGGYWKYPYASDTPPVSGLPEGGGTTNVGAGFYEPYGLPIAVGSYSQSSAPWGLLDVSGGVAEFTEMSFVGSNQFRWSRGSRFSMSESDIGFFDSSDWTTNSQVSAVSLTGLRLASVHVPTPAGSSLLALLFVSTFSRRGRPPPRDTCFG